MTLALKDFGKANCVRYSNHWGVIGTQPIDLLYRGSFRTITWQKIIPDSQESDQALVFLIKWKRGFIFYKVLLHCKPFSHPKSFAKIMCSKFCLVSGHPYFLRVKKSKCAQNGIRLVLHFSSTPLNWEQFSLFRTGLSWFCKNKSKECLKFYLHINIDNFVWKYLRLFEFIFTRFNYKFVKIGIN